MYSFHTPTSIPLEAFTSFGVHAKPNTTNPLGHFGTGLKYAVAIILRMGGKIRLVVDGTEYEFYTMDANFRGKMIKKVRMRKRNSILAKWRSTELAFTTELGKNWGLWQAFRELESNTRDENGTSGVDLDAPDGGTLIEVTCNGFDEVSEEQNQVFLDTKGPKVGESTHVTIYDSPSKYIYYRGVRVHEMQYPARFTYDFKQGMVQLSEDRSAMDVYSMFAAISQTWIKDIHDSGAIFKALNKSKRVDESHFEGHDLSYNSYFTPSNAFKSVARKLTMRGMATDAVTGFYYNLDAREQREKEEAKQSSLTLDIDEWKTILGLLIEAKQNAIADKIENALKEDGDTLF